MLSLQTVLPDTLELLKALMNQPLLYEMRLVGGTSLALLYGHRRSVDFIRIYLCVYETVYCFLRIGL